MVYCKRSDVEDIFGAVNLEKWADLDNNGVAAAITAKINRGCVMGSAEVDDRLRGSLYTLPIQDANGQIPNVIIQIAATYAGVWCYESRGIADYDPDTGAVVHKLQYLKDRAARLINEILANTRRLDAVKIGDASETPTAEE